jgi:hypothetical protein
MRLASISKSAKDLDLSSATIRARIKSGEWPCYRFGKKSVRVDLDEIRTLLRFPGKLKTDQLQEQASAE